MENARELVYRSRHHLDDFERENPFWHDLYEGLYKKIKKQVFIIDSNERSGLRGLRIPAVDMLNEVAYQCYRAATASHPEDCFEERFLKHPLKNNPLFTDMQECEMCFALVYAVFKLCKREDDMDIQPFLECYEEERIRYIDEPYSIPAGYSYSDRFIEDAHKYVMNNNKQYRINLFTGPESPDVLSKKSPEWWADVTLNFDELEIRDIISRWNNKLDRGAINKIICNAYKRHKADGRYVKNIDFVMINNDIFKEAYVYEDGEIAIDPLVEPILERKDEELYLYPITDLMDFPVVNDNEPKNINYNAIGNICEGMHKQMSTNPTPTHPTPPTTNSTTDNPKKGKNVGPKSLFLKPEDEAIWKERLTRFFADEINTPLNASEENGVLRCMVWFLHIWEKKHIIISRPNPATIRFLQKCGFTLEAAERTISNVIGRLVPKRDKYTDSKAKVLKFVQNKK